MNVTPLKHRYSNHHHKSSGHYVTSSNQLPSGRQMAKKKPMVLFGKQISPNKSPLGNSQSQPEEIEPLISKIYMSKKKSNASKKRAKDINQDLEFSSLAQKKMANQKKLGLQEPMKQLKFPTCKSSSNGGGIGNAHSKREFGQNSLNTQICLLKETETNFSKS